MLPAIALLLADSQEHCCGLTHRRLASLTCGSSLTLCPHGTYLLRWRFCFVRSRYSIWSTTSC